MGKKQKKDKKKGKGDISMDALEVIEDEDGIPKHAVSFRLHFEIEQTGIENYYIQMNFINNEDPEQLDVIKTPLIENWDEKEDDTHQDDEKDKKPKDKKEKKDKKGKKAKIKGKGKKVTKNMPEDEQGLSSPVTVVYEETIGPFKVSDAFAEKLCHTMFYVYLVNDSTNIINQLLFPTRPKPFKYSNDKILVQQIEKFDMSITPSSQLLSKKHRIVLNPFQLCVVGAKKLPTVIKSKYLPVYVKCKFFNGDITKTQGVFHNSVCK